MDRTSSDCWKFLNVKLMYKLYLFKLIRLSIKKYIILNNILAAITACFMNGMNLVLEAGGLMNVKACFSSKLIKMIILSLNKGQIFHLRFQVCFIPIKIYEKFKFL